MAEFLIALVVSGIFFALFFGVLYAGRAYSNRAYSHDRPDKSKKERSKHPDKHSEEKEQSKSDGMGCVWMLFLFFLLFLPTWGVGLWTRSAGGPQIMGVKVLNYLFIALIFTVLIAAINAAAGQQTSKDDESGLKLLHVFLWIFLGLMGIAIIAGLLL